MPDPGLGPPRTSSKHHQASVPLALLLVGASEKHSILALVTAVPCGGVNPKEVLVALFTAWEFRNKGPSFLCHGHEREANVLVWGEGRVALQVAGPVSATWQRGSSLWQMAAVAHFPTCPEVLSPVSDGSSH